MKTLAPPPRKQRGIVTALAAILLFAVVIYWLQQTFGIIGNTSQSNVTQLDSTRAFFLAESGLERGKATLSDSGPNSSSVCNSLDTVTEEVPIDGGTFSLSGEPAPSGCISDCTSCTVTSTGVIGGARRTLVAVMSAGEPGGGAAGCGGGGSGGSCPIPAYASDYHASIQQSITLTSTQVPALIVSSMGYQRHPISTTNKVETTGCVAANPGIPGACYTLWTVESSHSSGTNVVGNRGASIMVDTAQDYTFTQQLTSDSLFAAISALVPQASSTVPLEVAGVGTNYRAFWDDESTGANNPTTVGTSTTGRTLNGAACTNSEAPPPPGANCSGGIVPPAGALESDGTAQTNTAWCYDADTLLFGAAGTTDIPNPKPAVGVTGAITSFKLGTSPQSKPVPTPADPQGVVSFPKPAGNVSSEVYATLRFLHNPTYHSHPTNAVAGSASTGGSVLAMAGVPKGSGSTQFLVGKILAGTLTTLAITANNSSHYIYYGDEVYCTSNNGTCTTGSLIGTINGFPSGSGCTASTGNKCNATGDYGITNPGGKTVNDDLSVKSKYLQVASVTDGWLSISDSLSADNQVTFLNQKVVAVPPTGCASTYTCQTAGTYTLSSATLLSSGTGSSLTLVASGRTVHVVTSGTDGPLAGTIIDARYPANGRLISRISPAHDYNRACVSASPTPTATLFYLDTYNDTGTPGAGFCDPSQPFSPLAKGSGASRLINDRICGGICAFFDHGGTTAPNLTTFALQAQYTKEWASGMTCIKGANKDGITGLIGSSPTVTMTSWRELVR